MPRRKHRIGRISSEHFSARYKGLSLVKRIAVRRRMKKRVTSIWDEVDKATERAVKFNEKLTGILGLVQALKPVKVDLQREKMERHRLEEERKRLAKDIAEFQKFAAPHFKCFQPEMPQTEIFYFNPLERAVHAIKSGLGPAGALHSYLVRADKALESIERELARKRRQQH